ncbi:hypothetical protein FRC04_011266 [Tulasnella sp. 424]|nr:hypothetical protein FRC04_011266 [Tulasnella sp. 424]
MTDIAPLKVDFLIFRGDGNLEAEDFIRAVNIQAFKIEKSDDQKWTSTFASISFSGKALRWYQQLPLNTRQDWGLLQKAILDNDWESQKSASLLIPIAASAVNPPAAPPTPSVAPLQGKVASSPSSLKSILKPIVGPKKTGRIRVLVNLIDDAINKGYLSLNATGTLFQYCRDRDQAINVEWDSSSFPCRLKILVRNIYLTPVTQPKNGVSMAMTASQLMNSKAAGPVFSAFWYILEDGTVMVIFGQGGARYQMQVNISNAGITRLASDPKAANRKWPNREFKTAY